MVNGGTGSMRTISHNTLPLCSISSHISSPHCLWLWMQLFQIMIHSQSAMVLRVFLKQLF